MARQELARTKQLRVEALLKMCSRLTEVEILGVGDINMKSLALSATSKSRSLRGTCSLNLSPRHSSRIAVHFDQLL